MVFRDPTHITEENWVDMDKVSEIHKKLAEWIRDKMYGVDVREALARMVEQTASDLYDDKEIAAALEKLAKDLQAKWDSDTQKLIDEWKNTIGGITVDSELINSRIDLHGIVYKTLKERLDDMQSAVLDMHATEELCLITHGTNRYPDASCFYYDYLFGGDEYYDKTTDNLTLINCKIENLDKCSFKIFVPFGYRMNEPEVEKLSDGSYLVSEGNKCILIQMGA